MSDPVRAELFQRARRAIDDRQSSPASARTTALDVLGSTGDPEIRATAMLAIGMAERELNDLSAAEARLLDARRLIEQHALTDLRPQATAALVSVLVAGGRPHEALELAETARPGLEGAPLADLELKVALALELMGRIGEAIEAYDRALPVVVALGDDLQRARLLCNRGVALAYRGELDRAIADSAEAERLAVDRGQFLLAGGAANNLAFAAGRSGRIVFALDAFQRAEDSYRLVGFPGRSRGVLAADRSEVLLAAGLFDDARVEAAIAVESLEGADDVNDLAEARLLHARTLGAAGLHDDALATAGRARRDFDACGRAEWAGLAEAFEIRCSVLGATDESPTVRVSATRIEQIADLLDASGWPAEAVSIRVSAADLAVRSGDAELAQRHLGPATTARRRGRPDRRANAWLATARLRDLRGNRAGAQRAVDAGLRLIARHQATLGATELRVGATVHARELAELGVELAVSGGRPRSIMRAAERARANGLRTSVASSTRHAEHRAARSGLRDLEVALRAASLDGPAPSELAEEFDRQESRVRELGRRVERTGETTDGFDLERLFTRLADRTLVEFIEHRGRIGAVVVADRRCRYHDLVALDDLADVVEGANFAAARAARSNASEASAAAAMASLDECSRLLDDRLVAPLRVRDAHVVVVPTGSLHNVAWSALPSLATSPFVVTPSARHWSSRSVHPIDRHRVRAVAGPDLIHADDEVAVVAAEYDDAEVLTGDAATVDRVRSLLEGSGIVHVACHGRFRSDSPMFSSLRFADGSLSVYDVEDLSSAPDLVVMSSCSTAARAVSVGDELIGTAAALIGAGVGSVVAPATVINDAASVPLMRRLHERLVAGDDVATAMSFVRSSPEALATSAARAALGALFVLE